MTAAYPVGGGCRLALAILAALLAAPPALAQAPADAGHRFAYETHVFRRLLKDQGLEPLSDFRQLHDDAGKSLLIVLGRTDPLNWGNLPNGLDAFVRQGGAVLVATDRPSDFEAQEMLSRAAGVQVRGERLLGPETDNASYRRIAFCPFLVPVPHAQPDLFGGPRLDSTARLLHVATNVPTWLRPVELTLPDGIHRLAMLPPGSLPESAPPGAPRQLRQFLLELGAAFARIFPERGKVGPLFAVGGNRGDGRILVLADHSIFINQMMLPGDTDNVEFTYNALEWLNDGKRRTRVLLVQDGVIRTELDVPLKEVALPQEAVAAAADKMLADLERRDAFNRKIWQWLLGRAGNSTDRIARWVLEALTLLALAYAAYRVLVRARHRLDTAVPLLAHAAAGHTPAVPLLQQRFEAAHQAGNLWETAHHLARQYFAAVAPAAAGRRPPPIAVRGGWWYRWQTRRRFGRLWRLAQGSAPARVRPRRLRRLLGELEELKAALAAGNIQLR
jgi:hypothetical protein